MIVRVSIFILFVNYLCVLSAPKDAQIMRFTKVECSTSGITSPKYECYVKAISRRVTTLNFNFTSPRPLYKIMVNLTMDYKYITTYRQVLKVPVIDACKFVDGSASNPLVSMIMNIFRDAGFGHIIHACPYTEMVVYNFTQLGHSYYDIFPSGDYRVSLHSFDDEDPKIMKILFHMNINSPIKTSF